MSEVSIILPRPGGRCYNPGGGKRDTGFCSIFHRDRTGFTGHPISFFKALQEINRSKPELGKKIKIKFAGKSQAWLPEMIASFGLERQVDLLGEISHVESLALQANCDALLITSAKQLGGRDYSIAGKTFEYLQMQKPIIAFVCEGAQKDLLTKSGTALLCDPDRTEESVTLLSRLFEGKTELHPDTEFLAGLSREKLTAELAKIIKSLV